MITKTIRIGNYNIKLSDGFWVGRSEENLPILVDKYSKHHPRAIKKEQPFKLLKKFLKKCS